LLASASFGVSKLGAAMKLSAPDAVMLNRAESAPPAIEKVIGLPSASVAVA